jgi:hypothetical protein
MPTKKKVKADTKRAETAAVTTPAKTSPVKTSPVKTTTIERPAAKQPVVEPRTQSVVKPQATKPLATLNPPQSGRPSLDELKSTLSSRKDRLIKLKQEAVPEDKPKPITEGPVDKITEVLVNPTPEMLLSITDFDRNQVSLIPQIVAIEDLWDYLEKVAIFRSDRDQYEKLYRNKYPETPDTAGQYITVLARCRRSLGAKTQKAFEDLALADLETRNNEDSTGESLGSGSGFD